MLTLREPPALFFDCTHDNEVPPQRRHASDSLSNAALTWMVDCPVGSVRGYDEIVPERIDLVHVKKQYPFYGKELSGMTQARAVLNKLHRLETQSKLSCAFSLHPV